MTLDLPVEGQPNWDEKLNAALVDLDDRAPVLTPEQFGAVGGAVADDSDALEDWLDALIAAGGNAVGVLGGARLYRVTRSIKRRNCGVPLTIRSSGGRQAFLIGDFVGAGAGILDLSNDNGASSYSTAGHRISGIGFLGRGVPGDPIGLLMLNSYEHQVDDIDAPSGTTGGAPAWPGNPTGLPLANSVLVVTNDNNSKWNNIRGQAGWQPKAFDTGAATASFTAADQTVIASSGVFTDAMVGKTIIFASGSDTGDNAIWTATIASRTSATEVEIDTPAPSTASDVRFAVGYVLGSIVNGSSSLALADVVGLSANYLGMQVHVIGAAAKADAGSSAGLLSTTITDVDVATKTLTLADAATVTVANAVVLFAPNIFVGSFQGDPSTRQTNHTWWLNTHSEGFGCAGLIVNKVIYASFSNLKVHGAAYSYATDWSQCYYPAVFSEVKELHIDDVQAAYGVFGTKFHISGSRGLLAMDNVEISNLVKDQPAIVGVGVTEEFRLVLGNTLLTYPLTSFATTYMPYSMPMGRNVVSRGQLTHRTKQGTVTKTPPLVARGLTAVEGALVINDDSVATFRPPSHWGMVALVASAAGISGHVQFRTSEHVDGAYTFLPYTPVAGNALAVATGPMTGTTGTDGKVTVSADASGNLQIENRRGFQIRVAVIVTPFGT